MTRIVIAAFKAKPGAEAALIRLVGKHWQVLRGESLVTERPRVAMRSEDGTVIEVFEWASSEAIERAHTNPTVQALWAEFADVCDCVPIAEVADARTLFSEFTALPI